MPPSTLPSREPAPAAGSNSRVIRVFLSSTFRDFMQERDLLVKQVFPELRRKARERGVEVVDVDLRWGITEEESRQGKVIPICLGEIDRCRPYFVGMLGERYGWIPPADQYSPQVIERQPWLTQHLGGVSVTELEILHGVLNDPAMAGRAFFYFRDPAWSNSQSEPGFVCSGPAEAAKLADLKQRILDSGFPVAENLPDPKSLADQIGSDLWELIEQQYPDIDEADALEREERQHASYRRSRLGIYLGGKRSINQLERWIDAGQQKILITGESGAGKSALIANWIEVHRQNHPEDVVLAHHLGCSNDASAIRPLLARLIDTAKQQLPEVYGYSLNVPQDWWELVAKAVEALQSLGRWAQQNNHRWIWVLDGLDRLDPDDQKALPWFPLTIPEGVVIMASALECPAREILLERKCKTRNIAPLTAKEQDALIRQYLGRYTKQLIAELRQTILSHPLAGSPLFLRVLLEELRQCGRYETLSEQLAGYLSAERIDDLYERVLERLEADGNGEIVRKVMTALWASRAGLSEEELLSITGLKPLEWAPIDLALEEALGRNGNRLMFDHDYMRQAVEDRYLPTEGERRQAHSDLADWFKAQSNWSERTAEEIPWQLQQGGRHNDLKDFLVKPSNLAYLEYHRSAREAVNYWLWSTTGDDRYLDTAIMKALDEEFAEQKDKIDIWLINRIASVLDEAGLHRDALLRLRHLSLSLEEAKEEKSEKDLLNSLAWLARTYYEVGKYAEAETLYFRCLDASELAFGEEHRETMIINSELANLYSTLGDYVNAESYYKRLLAFDEKVLGVEHPSTLLTINNLGCLYSDMGDELQAEIYYKRALEGQESLLGPEHDDTLTTLSNLGCLLRDKGLHEKAEPYLKHVLQSRRRLRGPEHPSSLIALGNLGQLYKGMGEYIQAESCLSRALTDFERILGTEHPLTITTGHNLACLLREKNDHEKSEAIFKRLIESEERMYGKNHMKTVSTRGNLAELYQAMGDHIQAEFHYVNCLGDVDGKLGANHPLTKGIRASFANFLSEQQRYDESIALRRLGIELANTGNGEDRAGTLALIHELAQDLYWNDELQESEQLYREALSGRIAELGDQDRATMASRYGLARCLSEQERYEEAIELRRVELTWCQANDDVDVKNMLISMHGLGSDLLATGQTDEALVLLQHCLSQRLQELGSADDDTLETLDCVLEAYAYLGREREGLALSREAQAALSAELGEHHPKVLTQMCNQASLHAELGELVFAESLYKRCLQTREQTLGVCHADTLSIAFNLADVLSQQGRYAEAIPLRRRELAWCREQTGDIDPGTLSSINGLAINLREAGELEEAESLFRELVASRQQVLDPGDFQIGQALSGLAKTLEEAGKLEEALTYSQQALDHRQTHEGSDAWWTNRERLDLARVPHKLGRNSEAIARLQELQESMARINEPDEDDCRLISDAEELMRQVEESSPEKS